MAATRGRQPAPLSEQLFAEPHRFDFFQAVRLLHLMAAERARGEGATVGRDARPNEEPVRMGSLPSLGFPLSSVRALAPAAGELEDEGRTPPTMVVSCFGLFGATGALPDHYTELVIRRGRQHDSTLREFYSVFDHRALSLFHRAWEKYRLAMQFERSATSRGGARAAALVALQALVGRATSGQAGRLGIAEDVFLRFSGHFAARTRPAASLAAMLADYFELPVEIVQFREEFLRLPLSERTRLPSAEEPHGRHRQLGGGAVLGGHAYDDTGRFEIRVGPLRWEQFRRLMPTGDLLEAFCQLTRSFVGPALAFDVRPVLEPDQAPQLALAAEPPDSPRLGWNTWLRSKPLQRQFDGVSFSLDCL